MGREILQIFALILAFSYCYGITSYHLECEIDDDCINITNSVCTSSNCSCLDSDVLRGSGCAYDCGVPQVPPHGNWSTVQGTLEGVNSEYECDAGYRLVGNAETTCVRGGWDTVPPICERGQLGDDCSVKPNACDELENAACNAGICDCKEGFVKTNGNCSIVVCGVLSDQQDGNVDLTEGTEYNNTAIYSCLGDFQLIGDKSRRCLNTGKWNGLEPSCVRNVDAIVRCETDTDSRATVWTEVISGSIRTEECRNGFSGNVTRVCQADGRWKYPEYNCIRETVEKINDIVNNLDRNTTEEIVSDVLVEIRSVTTPNDDIGNQEKLTSGELRVLSTSLQKVADVLSSSVNILNDNMPDDFIEAASNLIDNSNQESWKSLTDSIVAEQILKAVDSLGEALSKTLDSTEKKTVVVKQNIAFQVKRFANIDVVFPDPELIVDETDSQEIRWIKESKSNFQLDSNSIKTDDNSTPYAIAAAIYRDLSDILPRTKGTESESSSNDDTETEKDNDVINAPVLAMTVWPKRVEKLDPQLKITFEHTRRNLTAPMCVFWKFQSGSSGYWSTEGCKLTSTNPNVSICECDHLTNFAVLMSPFKEAEASSKTLRTISIVGIGISIAFLVVTMCVYFILWKYLRNDRTTVLMNLCIALLIAYITFLSGVDRTESKVACAAIAAVLQYIYLAVFSIMLVEGIDIAMKVIYVFESKLRIRRMLVLAWVIPAVVVGISLGASKLEGYGNENFCWLSIDNGLIWAFIAPALLIITVNGILLVVVLYTMFKTKVIRSKKMSEKIQTSLRSLCVLLPVMGVSWILGIFYINDSFYFVQYIFAILNGLQGFFIFLFHCLLNAQVKKACKHKRRRREFMSLFKHSSKEDKMKDSRGFGRSYLESDGNEQNAGSSWREKALQPEFGFPHASLQLSKSVGIPDTGRPSASFSVESRDLLTGNRAMSYPEHVQGLSNDLEDQLFSFRL